MTSSKGKTHQRPQTIAMVLVRRGRNLKHESFADLKKIKPKTAEIKWHVSCRKDIVPETVFVANFSYERQGDEVSGAASLKLLVRKGVFEVSSDCSDGDNSTT